MNALERLAQAGNTNSVGTYSFVDADTLRDPKLKDENGFYLFAENMLTTGAFG